MRILSASRDSCPQEKVAGEIREQLFNIKVHRTLYWDISEEIQAPPLQLAQLARPGDSLMGTILRTISFTKDVKL